jgi:hypothetical protein
MELSKRREVRDCVAVAAIRTSINGSLLAVNCRSSPCPVCRQPDQLVCADEPQVTKER